MLANLVSLANCNFTNIGVYNNNGLPTFCSALAAIFYADWTDVCAASQQVCRPYDARLVKPKAVTYP